MDPQDDEIVRLLMDSTNRTILAALHDADRDLSVGELARRVVAEDGTGHQSDAGGIDRMQMSLHHNHLPRLADAGLIEYDPTDDRVAVDTDSVDDATWADPPVLDELLDRLGTSRASDQTVELLDGRETVHSYCHSLADAADRELFLIYASDDLLDDACLPYAQRAIDRGVAFYAGAKSQDARAFFRDQLPEATIWEPQFDWLYARADYPQISRLIVADREAVLVGLWDEDAMGAKTEIALAGEGRTNPLVILVRELLGSRLDHLDYQSDDFLGDLPFEP